MLFVTSLLLLPFLLLFHPQPRSLSAQEETSWILPTTIGYGGLGCGGGYLATSEAIKAAEAQGDRSQIGSLGIALGTLGGCWIGIRLGHRTGAEADSLLAVGEALAAGHRRGVQFGTVLAGATLGTLLSFFHVSAQTGRDAEIITTYALAGAAAGALVQVLVNRRLYPQDSPSSLHLARGREGGVLLGLVFRF
jgi:hypothetical protein